MGSIVKQSLQDQVLTSRDRLLRWGQGTAGQGCLGPVAGQQLPQQPASWQPRPPAQRHPASALSAPTLLGPLSALSESRTPDQ